MKGLRSPEKRACWMDILDTTRRLIRRLPQDGPKNTPFVKL